MLVLYVVSSKSFICLIKSALYEVSIRIHYNIEFVKLLLRHITPQSEAWNMIYKSLPILPHFARRLNISKFTKSNPNANAVEMRCVAVAISNLR